MSQIKNKNNFFEFENGVRSYLLSRNFSIDYMLLFEECFVESYLEFQDKFDYNIIERSLSSEQIKKKEFSFLLTNVKRKMFNLYKKRNPKKSKKDNLYSENINPYISSSSSNSENQVEEGGSDFRNYLLSRLKLLSGFDLPQSSKNDINKYIEYQKRELRRSLWKVSNEIPEDVLLKIISEKDNYLDFLDFETPPFEPKSVSKILKWHFV